ncbi:MAG: VanZ family protein [Flavobacteriales bacterium]|nr:VanZ family protein [Flavobacteriales bacterium]
MAFYTSHREKKIWTWVLLILIGIFSTIIIDRPFRGVASQNVAALLFLIGMALVAATVITQGWKRKPSNIELWVVIGIIAVYVMVFTRMTIRSERSHLIEYGVLAIFIFEALKERKKQKPEFKHIAIKAIVLSVLVGFIDEGIQYLVPSRVFDQEDIVFDVLAAIMAVFSSLLISWARKKYETRKSDLNKFIVSNNNLELIYLEEKKHIKIDRSITTLEITKLLDLLWKESAGINFHDIIHPQLSDPGAYFFYSSKNCPDKRTWKLTLGNHGWSGGMYLIKTSTLAQQLNNLIKRSKISSIEFGDVTFFSSLTYKGEEKSEEMNRKLMEMHS